MSTSLYPVLRTCFSCKTRTKYKCAQAFAHWTLTALRSVEFRDFTQLQRSGCKEKRMQRGRQIWHLTVNLAIEGAFDLGKRTVILGGKSICACANWFSSQFRTVNKEDGNFGRKINLPMRVADLRMRKLTFLPKLPSSLLTVLNRKLPIIDEIGRTGYSG